MLKIRNHPSLFQRYQSHSDLVNLLNYFANTRTPLPKGWTSKTDAAGKVCSVNSQINIIKNIVFIIVLGIFYGSHYKDDYFY